MDGKNTYHISQLHMQCPYSCSISCVDCKICIHAFSCNCPDALIRATICKHIHLLMQFISATNTTIDVSQMEETHQGLNKMDESVLLESLQDPKQSCKLLEYRDGIHSQLATLTTYLNATSDMDTLHDVKTLITSALNLIKARQENTSKATLPVAIEQPANKNIPTQRSFFSTRKRKATKPNVRLAKPTIEQKTEMYKTLLNGPLKQAPSPLKQSTYSE